MLPRAWDRMRAPCDITKSQIQNQAFQSHNKASKLCTGRRTFIISREFTDEMGKLFLLEQKWWSDYEGAHFWGILGTKTSSTWGSCEEKAEIQKTKESGFEMKSKKCFPLKLYWHAYVFFPLMRILFLFLTGQPAGTKTSDGSHLVADFPLQWLLHCHEKLVGINTCV